MATSSNQTTPAYSGMLRTLENRIMQFLLFDGEKLAWLVIFVLAILSRFWGLGDRVMSHDESLHTRFSWGLYQGEGFSHTPLMHGPLLFHMTALSYLLFGDNDFTSRIYTAILGVAIVMMPVFMKKWLGKTGSIVASVGLLISPMMLYYSRYIRHDIPAILAAMVMAVATWKYIETRKFNNLLWLAGGFAVLFASKEVSFIYVAIYGSFLTVYFMGRMLDAPWESKAMQTAFTACIAAALVFLLGVGVAAFSADLVAGEEAADEGTAITEPIAVDPTADAVIDGSLPFDLTVPMMIALGGLSLSVLGIAVTGLIGQRGHLRNFPSFDVAMLMGTLILAKLSPFLITAAGFDPLDETPLGVRQSAMFTIPMIAISVLLGLWHFMEAPARTHVKRGHVDDQGNFVEEEVEVTPNLLDWVSAFFSSKWWAPGGIYWVFTLFFFTTMFTNAEGVGSGVVGSLGYWLAQQEVQRGGQPWYYYLLIQIPLYEFLPAILTTAAAFVGLGGLAAQLWKMLNPPKTRVEITSSEDAEEDVDQTDKLPDLHVDRTQPDKAREEQPLTFPVLGFLGYLAVMNLIAYSLAGEKMPWLTTHLTMPMILIGGWLVGRMIDRIDWIALWQSKAWIALLLLPVAVVATLRVLGPGCGLWGANPLCNTVIPVRYQARLFDDVSTLTLTSSGLWFGALAVLIVVIVAIVSLARYARFSDVVRLIMLFIIGWMTFLTIRIGWRAAYIDYDNATEFLVYAHSAGSVAEVMGQIEEMSLKTTDGYDLQIAYDNEVSWPMSWYFRDYPNAVYYAEQPTRSLIGDSVVILAGPSNFSKVESLIGDRYYKFDYIRMWWPMQDYFGYEEPEALAEMLGDIATDPALQRGLWDIFYDRDFDPYADAVAPYRGGSRPDFSLTSWPVAQRMYVYIRKDAFAEVWDYGVAASDIAEAIDPYAQNVREVNPALTFGNGLMAAPHGSDVGPDGNLYVADSQNHRIVVYSPDGTLVNTLGAYGLAPGEGLNEPWDVAVGPDGRVFVADTWNYRVAVFNSDGTFETSWGVQGPNELDNPYALWGPRGIAVDNNGMVYVADTGNKRVQVYSSEGDFVRQIGSGGALDGQLDEPAGLAIGPDGHLYVADTWNQRVQVFDANGTFLTRWTVEAWFAQSNERPYITVDEAGMVYITDPEAYRVIVFNGIGEYQYSFGDYIMLPKPGGIAIDDRGNLFVVDSEAGTVRNFELSTP